MRFSKFFRRVMKAIAPTAACPSRLCVFGDGVSAFFTPALCQGHRMGRLLRPVDIAATVGHLLSDSSAMMTGTIVDLHPERVSDWHMNVVERFWRLV